VAAEAGAASRRIQRATKEPSSRPSFIACARRSGTWSGPLGAERRRRIGPRREKDLAVGGEVPFAASSRIFLGTWKPASLGGISENVASTILSTASQRFATGEGVRAFRDGVWSVSAPHRDQQVCFVGQQELGQGARPTSRARDGYVTARRRRSNGLDVRLPLEGRTAPARTRFSALEGSDRRPQSPSFATLVTRAQSDCSATIPHLLQARRPPPAF